MEIRLLESGEDLVDAARLAYEIFVEECGVLGNVADHDERTLETDDARGSRTIGAFVNGELVGTLSALCWSNAPFPEMYHSAFQIHRFATVVPRERMAILTRWLIRSSKRRGMLPLRLYQAAVQYLLARDIALIFADCQPHMLPRYTWLGMRSFGRIFNYVDSGVVIPLVGIPADHDHLRRLASPTITLLPASSEDRTLAARLNEILAGDDPVTTPKSDPDGYWRAVDRVVGQPSMRDRNPFGDIAPADIRQVLERGFLLDFEQGDVLIGRGQNTRTVYVVVDGELEVRCDGVRRRLGVGEICGELAFLLDSRRTANVHVASRTARLLCLADRDILSVGRDNPLLAARFMANLSRIPARRLASRAS